VSRQNRKDSSVNTKQEHVDRFHEWMKVAESPDSKVAAYKRAAGELRSLHSMGLTWKEVGAAVGYSESWAHKLMAWSETGGSASLPFGGAEQNQARYERHERLHDRRKVSEIAAERPEAIAEAIAKADPETQRKIADSIVNSGTAEPSLAHAVNPPDRKPREGKPTWRRLSDATFTLWEVGQQLMDEVPSGEERVRMISSAEKAQRLAAGIALLLNTGELDDAFRDLLNDIEVEA
jgi:hypothetical protein